MKACGWMLAGLVIATGITGCASRPIYKARSDMIRDAQAGGADVRSPVEDRALFFEHEKDQQTKLLDLVKQRAASVPADPSYRLGSQDEIEINVFDVPELGVTVPVRESGFVTLPLVGPLQAGGLTVQQFSDDLRKRMAGYVKNPQVSVFISHYGSQRVAVLGAVNKPDVYPLKRGSNSVVELISEAGGLSMKAGNVLNFIPKELSGLNDPSDLETRNRLAFAATGRSPAAGQGIEIYLDQVMGTGGGIPVEVPVRGGDMIVIPEAGKVLVEGEVEKIGSYELGQQMSLLGALAAAGGITYSANPSEVEVIRELGMNNRVSLVMDLTKVMTGEEKDVRLRNGDLVRVPSNTGKRMTSDTMEGIRKLLNFGIGGSFRVGP